MTSIYQQVLDSEIPKKLNDLIVEIEAYSTKNIHNLLEIKVIAESLVELVLLQEQIKSGPFRPIDFITKLNEAINSLLMINDFLKHGRQIFLWREKINELILIYQNILGVRI